MYCIEGLEHIADSKSDPTTASSAANACVSVKCCVCVSKAGCVVCVQKKASHVVKRNLERHTLKQDDNFLNNVKKSNMYNV